MKVRKKHLTKCLNNINLLTLTFWLLMNVISKEIHLFPIFWIIFNYIFFRIYINVIGD